MINTISAQALHQRLTIGNDGAAGKPVLLDVREAEELTAELGHLSGIVHIPLGEVLNRTPELAAHKKSEIVVICKKGVRAKTAALLLTHQGFAQVTVLTGGMNAYKAYEESLR